MEPFKERINAEAVQALATEIVGSTPSFDAESFVAEAVPVLDDLELKARVVHVAAALRRHLPADFEQALEVLLRGLAPPNATDQRVTEAFRYWPVLQVVEDYGVATPEASLTALREMTRRFSAEFAVRPFLTAHPELAWAAVEAWADDPDLHVRRLASEGTRPRLPWGGVLRDSVADPSRGLALISRLVDDDELYVRRSVANHLNDVAKDHPARAVATAADWLARSTEDRQWAARHGLRTLFRKGDTATLALFGFGPAPVEVVDARITEQVPYPGEAVLELSLRHTAGDARSLRVEWVVEAPRWRKVFRGPERELAAGEVWSIRKRFAMKPVSVRRQAPGAHRVGVLVNGEVLTELGFELLGGDPLP
ncbi:MAG: DNA alkylation repair protein [Deltaproteobacteria bacterium]|nr:MAG: DNA alkylation repair protein [Deltaproteobacteria bacterium]